ncbi:rhodanese-related sulfurtransferase [Cyanobacterium stanieri LEGE 03274]|uniref:tRNA uridine(34) hydroxylase n=1 Tax=Cyanobacterium stanieri LEGE 03274 TaxID=1828756 RepID=A0ABR9V657_9CHRO|nr:rhodanese-related sulfurtransferase [Cyanobacterium stanieri]MBE9223357.1 rhodanese-related sulfurtransferase [Cyanobacterium stanieri LEGE 03274]
MKFTFASFYHFTPLKDLEILQEKLLNLCNGFGIKGTILIASEGINSNIVGVTEAIDKVVEEVEKLIGYQGFDVKYSPMDYVPFERMKVKIKKEIITFGIPEANPNEQVGTYLSPREWNELISQSDVKLVDTRNDYEVEIGTFKRADNPHINSFREFNGYIEEHLSENKEQKVALFCTGGIRCEKVTALMLKKGFKEVYHLKGGILKYLEEVPEEESLWEGECFVFDDRVAVKHGLQEGSYQLSECGNPIKKESLTVDNG